MTSIDKPNLSEGKNHHCKLSKPDSSIYHYLRCHESMTNCMDKRYNRILTSKHGKTVFFPFSPSKYGDFHSSKWDFSLIFQAIKPTSSLSNELRSFNLQTLRRLRHQVPRLDTKTETFNQSFCWRIVRIVEVLHIAKMWKSGGLPHGVRGF